MTNVVMSGDKPLRVAKGISLLQGSLKGNEKTVVGVDPGSNFGMTIINRELVSVYYGKLPVDKRVGWRGILTYNFITKDSPLKSWQPNEYIKAVAVVEGAAYNKFHGQVALEEVRFGFFFALYQIGFDAYIMPPMAIRKLALGNGKKSMVDEFPSMNSNAADSIGAALAALTIEDKHE
jgi:hypothetical protein